VIIFELTAVTVAVIVFEPLVNITIGTGEVRKFAPLICMLGTVVQRSPDVAPEREVMEGVEVAYVYAPVPVAVPFGVVMTTFTVPSAWGGVIAVIEVPLTTVTLVADIPPIVTEVAPKRFVPVMVTSVPPTVGPEFGVILVNVGDAV
jgi:hypothetical protein